MSLDRRFLMSAATVFVLLVGTTSALAKTHTTRTTRISGVVLSINAKRHTLKLRVTHSAKHPKAKARAASAGGSPTIVIAFGDASVTGPNGAVAVGDDVTVTTDAPAGQTTVATSIDVVGQPNGGDAGKGAAVPGEVTAVDLSAGTLKLAVVSTDPQGQSKTGSVTVTVGPSTVLAVTGTSGGGKVTLADISVGDHVVVFTDDATADPIAAVGILDSGHATGGGQSGGGSPSTPPAPGGSTAPVYDAFAGTVEGIGTDQLQVAVTGDGPLGGQTVTVDVNTGTRYKGVTTDGLAFTFGDIALGDQVRVYTTTLDPQSLLAVFIGDGRPGSPAPTGPTGSTGSTGTPTPASSGPQRFGGVVTDVRGDGLTVTVKSGGPLNGQSVIVSVPAGTSFQPDPQTGAGSSLATISIGDAVEIHTNSETGTPIVAVGVSDDGVYPSD